MRHWERVGLYKHFVQTLFSIYWKRSSVVMAQLQVQAYLSIVSHIPFCNGMRDKAIEEFNLGYMVTGAALQ